MFSSEGKGERERKRERGLLTQTSYIFAYKWVSLLYYWHPVTSFVTQKSLFLFPKIGLSYSAYLFSMIHRRSSHESLPGSSQNMYIYYAQILPEQFSPGSEIKAQKLIAPNMLFKCSLLVEQVIRITKSERRTVLDTTQDEAVN